MVPSGAATNMCPAAWLCFQALRVDTLRLKGVQNQLEALVVANLDAPACLANIAVCEGVGASANRKVVYRIVPATYLEKVTRPARFPQTGL